MGDFERTFSAGADAASIIDAYSNLDDCDRDEAHAPTPEPSAAERIQRAKEQGAMVHWRLPITKLPSSGAVRSEDEYWAFGAETNKPVGRIYCVGRTAGGSYRSDLTGEWEFIESRETWAWSLFTNRTAALPFRTYGVVEGGHGAEAAALEAYGNFLAHCASQPRFFICLAEHKIVVENTEDIPTYTRVITDSASHDIICSREPGSDLFAVFLEDSGGLHGSAHRDVRDAVAAFGSYFDGRHKNGRPAVANFWMQVKRAMKAMLAEEAGHQTVELDDNGGTLTMAKVVLIEHM